MSASASILGASGFAGGELLRLLAGHPGMHVAAAAHGRTAIPRASSVHPHMHGADLPFVDAGEALAAEVDVLFSCLPSGKLEPVLDRVAAATVIDLSDEHRPPKEAGARWAYGLTEFFRADLASTDWVANPGCYPTATLLAIAPFVREGSIEGPLVVDGMSGISGAGRKLEDRLLAAVADGSVGAYGTTSHRHVPEMEAALARLSPQSPTISFTPHLVPIARGLLATVRARLSSDLDDEGAFEILRTAYDSEPFVTVMEGWPSTKAVAGSNHAHVTARVDDRNGMLICSAAIDNLGKGAAGQAIQNANLLLGLEETAGLESMGVWP